MSQRRASLTVAEEHSPEPAADSRVLHRSGNAKVPFVLLDTPECYEESSASTARATHCIISASLSALNADPRAVTSRSA
ncbi:hypothetical protein PO909_002588 [Leuciscus waleckii]